MKFCLFCNQPLKYSPSQMKLMLERRCPHCRTAFPSRMNNPDYFRYTSPEAAEARRIHRKRHTFDDDDAFGKANRNP